MLLPNLSITAFLALLIAPPHLAYIQLTIRNRLPREINRFPIRLPVIMAAFDKQFAATESASTNCNYEYAAAEDAEVLPLF